ncbi:MAG: hypothetical protein PHR19_08255 [Bacteroidales bacterium]|nr:hypothetical protein [Bacteroidales bacterium]
MRRKYLDISLIQYINSPDHIKEEYDIALMYSNYATEPRDTLKIGPLTSQTFGKVKDIQTMYIKGLWLKDTINLLSELTGKALKEIVSISVFDFFAQKAYLDAEIRRIVDTEGKLLAYTPTMEEEAAGLDRFNKFGVALQLDSLAGGDVLKWEEVRALPYEIAILKLVIDKTKNDYSKDLNDIIKAKHKHN